MDLDHAHPTDQVRILTDTYLHGGWLVVVRVAWAVLVLFTLGVFIASLPADFALLKMPCTGLECTVASGQLAAGDIQALQKFGLSIDAYAAYWIALNTGVTLVWCVVGGVLVWRKSNDWLVLLVALMLIMAGTGFVTANLLLSPSIWRIPENWLCAIQSLAILYTFALFPNGRPASRWIGWIPLLYPAQLICYLLFLNQLHLPDWSLYRNPLNAVSWFGCEAVLAAAQLYRYFRVSNQIERQQTKWVAYSFLITLVADFGGTAAANLLSVQQVGLFSILIVSISTCLFLVFPLSIGIAILRYRLWDIDIIIRRTLVYGALTAYIVGIYILVVGYLGTLFRTSSNLLISLVGAGLVAILFQPLRIGLQRGVNRLFYGQRDEPYRVVSRLGQRLEATLVPDAVLPTIVETVAQALKLPYAAIILQQDGTATTVASYGKASGELLRLSLSYQSERIGELVLALRSPGESFTPADRRLLDDLARQAGVAVHAVRLTQDLQRLTQDLQHARERLVSAREEERRRLRRDLHDGLGPQLSSQTLLLTSAQMLLRQDPDEAEAILKSAVTQSQQAISDIRRLVYALRPPSLDDLGLLAAIGEQLTRYRASGISFSLEAPEQLPSLPAAVEVACYRIVQEALTNVVRHAHAHTCVVRLACREQLTIEVTDDGLSLPPAYRCGVGLNSMRERAEELGGSWHIEPGPQGGTHMHAELPYR